MPSCYLGLLYEAVLFDFDGVLADTEPVHYDCWKVILDQFGIPFPWDRYEREFIGLSDRDMITLLARENGVPVESVMAEHPRKKDLFRERMSGTGAISEDVRRLLQDLSAAKLAVVTSSGRNEIEPILTRAGIAGYFATAVYGNEVERLKPAPDPYRIAGERLGVTKALVVEDSAAGIASGRAAGFDVLEVPRQNRVVELVRAAMWG